jgi:hypothetical protein
MLIDAARLRQRDRLAGRITLGLLSPAMGET